jgi:hypothetical protein
VKGREKKERKEKEIEKSFERILSSLEAIKEAFVRFSREDSPKMDLNAGEEISAFSHCQMCARERKDLRFAQNGKLCKLVSVATAARR